MGLGVFCHNLIVLADHEARVEDDNEITTRCEHDDRKAILCTSRRSSMALHHSHLHLAHVDRLISHPHNVTRCTMRNAPEK